MNASELANGLSNGTITATAKDSTLRVDPLADPSGPDCYPATVIEFRRGDEVVASVGAWVLGQYMQGPTRHDNGAWIGQGWSWQVDESDGACTGRPRGVMSDDRASVTFAADNVGPTLTLALSGDDSDEDADDIEAIQDAIDAAHADIEVEPADDDEVAVTLLSRPRSDAGEITAEIKTADDSTEYLTVHLYAGNDAGRPVFTHTLAEGRVWEDAEDCEADARESLAGRLNDAAEGLYRNTDLIRRMERRAGVGYDD